ncbi:MAG: biotin/lipoate A/B protein ligase family protein [Candidatus Omnitrophota bacterium]
MRTFRLILSKYNDAATNMALDEALFLSYQEKGTEPVLRLYGWKPAAVSCGISQDPSQLFQDGHALNSSSFVRRPTGGGLIYHDDELTYSLVACAEDLGLETMSVKDSYEALTSFLIRAYRAMGLNACFAKEASETDSTASPAEIASVCFGRKEEYDILVGGRKLGGSAQKRAKNIILQHGSIPLSLDHGKLTTLLKDPSLGCAIQATSLKEALGKDISSHELKDTITDAFCSHFQVELRESGLTSRENDLVRFLKETKYGTPEWNLNKNDLSKISPHDDRTQTSLA